MKKDERSEILKKEFITPKELAKLGDVHLKTVRRWIKKGVIPYFQPGGKGCAVLIPKCKLRLDMLPKDFLSR